MAYEHLARRAARMPYGSARLRNHVEAKASPKPALQASAPNVAAPAAKATAPKLTTASADNPFGRGFQAGREIEQDRLGKVAEVALHRGRADEALRLLADASLDSETIIAKIGGPVDIAAADVWADVIADLERDRGLA